jgi:hypothetical protein
MDGGHTVTYVGWMFDRRSMGHDHAVGNRHNATSFGVPTPGKRTLTEELPASSEERPRPPGARGDHRSPASVGAMFGSHLAQRPGALPGDLQASMGRSFDADFSAVRIHQGGEAARLGALAYTQGTDIHFSPGQYAPDTAGGRQLIGHELAHVVQQANGSVTPTLQMKSAGLALNDDRGLEQEADRAGARAARGEPSGMSAGGRTLTAGGSAPVQMNVGETLLGIAASVLDHTVDSAAAAAAALAAYFNISTTTVYLVAAAGLAITAAIALLQRYQRREVPEDPDHAVLSIHVPLITGLIAAATPVPNLVGQLITRDWYKADSLTWAKKLKLFGLVANQLGDDAQRGLFAQVVDALATHDHQSGPAALVTLHLVLPVVDDAEPRSEDGDERIDQIPAQVKNELGQLRAALATAMQVKLFGRLDRIERRITAWFGRYKGQLDHPQRAAMFGCLDEIQQLHKQMTKQQIAGNLDLWLPELEPGEDRGRIQEIWHSILAGDGAFTFEQAVDQSFGKPVKIPPRVTRLLKIEVISQLGRLMSQPKGRALIATFFESGDTGVVNFKLAQLYRIVAQQYVGDSATPRNDGEVSLSSAPHVATGKRKGKGRTVDRGRGQHSDVAVTPNKKDSTFLDYDQDYNRILSPGYIGLGHELVHAAHNLHGVALGDWTLEGMPPEYHDLEEFVTIAPRAELEKYRAHKVTGGAYKPGGGTTATETTFGELLDLIGNLPNEADLRTEHGLDERHEHISGLSDHTTGHTMPQSGEVTDVVKTGLPKALQGLTI